MSIPKRARGLTDEQVYVDPNPPPAPPPGTLPMKRLRSNRGRHHGSDDLALLDYLLRDPTIYALADAVPLPTHRRGRRHTQPAWMNIAFAVLTANYRTFDATQRHLANPHRWGMARELVEEAWPHRPELHLPREPMTADAYFRFRNTYLADDDDFDAVHQAFRVAAAASARSMGYFDPSVGSTTHPAPTNVLFGDGKYVSAMFRALPGAQHVDPLTGAIEYRRADPDARRYLPNDGGAATGIPWTYLDCRRPGHRNERLVLDFHAISLTTHEMAVAMKLIRRTVLLLPATEAVVWDGSMHGTHMRDLIADLGLIPINKVAERSAGNWRRLGQLKVVRLDGQTEQVEVLLIRGTPTIRRTVQGNVVYPRFVRVKTTVLPRSSGGGYRVASDYVLPDHPSIPHRLRGARLRLRHDTTATEDQARNFILNENLRIIDQMDEDFDETYGIRNNAENINRRLEDTLWSRRAHSVGIPSQRLDHLAYAIYNNLFARVAFEERTGQTAGLWLPGTGHQQLALAI